jgi:hypothetical protein
MERAMKLTSAQIERTLGQFEAEAIPDSHPALPRLNELFGDHTFFLDRKGLNIVEPTADPTGGRIQVARVVNVAKTPIRPTWLLTSRNRLTPSSNLRPNTARGTRRGF